VQQIRRLLGPAEPLGRARQQLLRATAALALTPVLLALTPAVLALALGRVAAAWHTRPDRTARHAGQRPYGRCPASPRGTRWVLLRFARPQRQSSSRR
jgi:hypothetical protein